MALIAGLIIAVAGCDRASPGAEISPEDIESYPDQPITIVTWVNPGSPTDLLARAIARVGREYFGQRIDVLNRPGGSGAAAMSHLLARPADGYTLGIMTSSGAITMAAGQIPFQPEQFTYIQRIQLDPLLLAVRSEAPYEGLADFFEHAREAPGELSVAGFGATSVHFLSFSRLKAEAGDPDIPWVAYEGSSDAALAVLGGHVAASDNNFSVVREHLRAGSLRVLGVSHPIEELPDVPTYQEQGYDVDAVHWRGLMGPGGMPEDLVRKIHGLLQQTVEDPEFSRFMEESSNEYGLMDDPAEMQQWVLDEVIAARATMESLGLIQPSGAE